MGLIVIALFLVAFLALAGFLKQVDPPDAPRARRRRAYVLGVNYGGENASDDEGCWKDVSDLADALRGCRAFAEGEVLKYVDCRTDGKHFTSKTGMQKMLERAAARDDADLVYVHFCGRAVPDGIVASDGRVVSNEWLVRWATSFDPGTRVVATFDCAFAGTLPRRDRTVTFLSGESITHALWDAVKSSPETLNNASDLCMHVWDYVGACPQLSSTHSVIDDPAFLPARPGRA